MKVRTRRTPTEVACGKSICEVSAQIVRGLALLLLFSGIAPAASNDDELELSRVLRAMEALLGAPVLVPSSETLPDISSGRIDFHPIRPADHRNVLRYTKTHLEEFRKYPRSFLRKTGLDSIVYVKGLRNAQGKIAGTMLGSIESPSQRPHGSLVLDISESPYSDDVIRHVAHHELFHLVDFVHFADQETQVAWLRLNPPGFVYRRDAQACGGTFSTPIRGFVTEYATAEAGEDRADTFASLMVTTYYRLLLNRINTDSMLKRKVRLLKKQLHGIDPSLDDAFFLRLHR